MINIELAKKNLIKCINNLLLIRRDYINKMVAAKSNNEHDKKIIFLRLVIKLDSEITHLMNRVKDTDPLLYYYLLSTVPLDNISQELKEYAINYPTKLTDIVNYHGDYIYE